MAEIFARVFWRRIWSLAAKVAVSDSSSSLKNLIHHTRGVDRDGTAFGLQQGWDVDLSCRIKKPASHRATPVLHRKMLTPTLLSCMVDIVGCGLLVCFR